jgi:hypothetical protein
MPIDPARFLAGKPVRTSHKLNRATLTVCV